MISDHRWPLATATLCSAALCWATLLGCQDQGAAATQPAAQPAARTVPPVEPRPTRPADEPPHPVAVAAQTAPAQPSASPQQSTSAPAAAPAAPQPLVLIDCATSAMSAKRIEGMGIKFFPVFGQSDDPQSMKTGEINVSLLIDTIRKRLGPSPSGFAMLDFEDPFDDWLDLPVTDPRNRKASSEMVKAIKSVKTSFPNVKWTYYGQPRMARVFPDGKGWANGTDAQKKAELDRRIAVCSDILREVDWINPSIYDVYENAKFEGDYLAFMVKNETIWREQVVKLSHTIRQQLGLAQVPVIPCVSVYFQPGGKATNMKPISHAELLADQIDPALRAGADGFAIWTGMDFFQTLATMPDGKELSDLNRQNQRDARAAWTASYLDGKAPRDWTDPELKFTISQATGKTIADGAEVIVKRVNEHRAGQAANGR